MLDLLPSEPGRCYAMDFVHDRLANDRRFKCFTMTDLCSKEVPVIEVDASIGGKRICLSHSRSSLCGTTATSDRDPGQRTGIRGDRLDAWAGQHGVQLHFIQPGKPVQNACIESFNRKFRDECLDEHWFLTLQEPQGVIEAWRRIQEERDGQHHRGYDAHGVHAQPSINTGPRPHRSQLRWPWVTNRGRSNAMDANHLMCLYLAPGLRGRMLRIRQNVRGYILTEIQLFRRAHGTICSQIPYLLVALTVI